MRSVPLFVAAVSFVLSTAALAQEAAPPAVAPDQPAAAEPAPSEAAPAPAPDAAAPSEGTAASPRSKMERGHGHGCEKGHGGDGCGRHRRGHGEHGGWAKWRGGREPDPWFAAVEVGSVAGQGLLAQVSFRPFGGTSFGLGAIGFGDRSLDRFRQGQSDVDDDGGGRGRGFLQGGIRQGYFLSLTRYRSFGRSGVFGGVKLGVADAFLRTADGSPDATFWGAFVSPEVGVQWFPFQRRVFVRPAVGISAVVGRWGGSANAPVPPFLIPNASLSLGAAL